jgi:hypothetical protein
MALDVTARRRWFGGVMLLAALAMLVCGETVLRERLGPVTSLIFWLVCFVLTSLAIIVAFLDVRAVQRRIRQEQRELFESTLKKIQTEAGSKPRQSGQASGL